MTGCSDSKFLIVIPSQSAAYRGIYSASVALSARKFWILDDDIIGQLENMMTYIVLKCDDSG